MTDNGGNTFFVISQSTASVNGVEVHAGNTGVGPIIMPCSATGDSNVDLTVTGKGTGLINFGTAARALGGGAAPTLGTIGLTGPAVAAQNSWLPVKIAGVASYLPVWQ